MSKSKLHKKFIEEINELYPNYEVLGFYINNHTKIKIRDNKCGCVWLALPSNLLRGIGICPKCSEKNYSNKRNTPLEKFLIELQNKFGLNIEYITGYINKTTKCIFKCNTCGTVWKTTPKALLHSKFGCPKCAKEHTSSCLIISLEEVIKRIKTIFNDTIEYISGYINTKTKCKWKCKICNHEWFAPPNSLLNENGCAKCAHKKLSKERAFSWEKIQKLVEIETNGTIKGIRGQAGTSNKCTWQCIVCGHEWETTPNSILSKHSKCPLCSCKSLEKPVLNALNKKDIKLKHNLGLKNCKPNHCKYPLRPDFYIETEKGILWIECDGQQHHLPVYGQEALKKLQNYDKFKNEYCKEHHICLIRVTSSTKWGTEKHIILQKILELIEIGIDSKTKEIDFDLFWKYDFNRE